MKDLRSVARKLLKTAAGVRGMPSREMLWDVLRIRERPVHACWFCSGPEHFAAVAGSVATRAVDAGEWVHVLAPPAFTEALSATLHEDGTGRLRLVRASHLSGIELLRFSSGWQPGSWIIHVVENPLQPATIAPGVWAARTTLFRARAVARERVLEKLAEAGLVRCLCVYHMGTVPDWEADRVVEQHHRWLACGARLLPVTEALASSQPAVTPPPAPAR